MISKLVLKYKFEYSEEKYASNQVLTEIIRLRNYNRLYHNKNFNRIFVPRLLSDFFYNMNSFTPKVNNTFDSEIYLEIGSIHDMKVYIDLKTDDPFLPEYIGQEKDDQNKNRIRLSFDESQVRDIKICNILDGNETPTEFIIDIEWQYHIKSV